MAITQDSFIVYTSNVFAILGLRALYFALAGIMELFHHIHYALAAVLSFIGIKMILSPWIHIGTGISLTIVMGTLAISIITSKAFPSKIGLCEYDVFFKKLRTIFLNHTSIFILDCSQLFFRNCYQNNFEPTEWALSDRGTYVLSVEGSTSNPKASIPVVSGMKLCLLGPSKSIQFINGKTTTSAQYTFAVDVEAPGEY